ncbi:F-box protein At5g46170-like [Diospyros lotus]|uniref:F-box protein At5g46170-like n=1 Tax=Diospyros lotus TaxID=55363 RepID=UPI00224E12BD|nr:F-box protein At5g46170-like [Diospyros lotus]
MDLGQGGGGETDQFDRLPDALLRLIFNRLKDAESLTRCSLVCKRFASVVPQVDAVVVRLPPKTNNRSHRDRDHQIVQSGGGSRNRFRNLIRRVITRPLLCLLQIITLKSSSCLPEDDDDYSLYYSPNQVLKNFEEIRLLRIELPGHVGEIGSNAGGDSLLRWRAEFGSELESCVVLGAKSLRKLSQTPKNTGEQQQLLLSDDELKLRVVWTISCLISASSRHYMLQEVVSEHRMLQRVVVSDKTNQGRLCMRTREQIEDLRSKLEVEEQANSTSDLSPAPGRTPVPALMMKLWYVPELELPESGRVMEAATLVVIKPVVGSKKVEKDRDLVRRVCNMEDEDEEEEHNDDDAAFGEAVREMMKKKQSYTLEMNSF